MTATSCIKPCRYGPCTSFNAPIKYQNEENMWSQWLQPWHETWNCWSPGIFRRTAGPNPRQLGYKSRKPHKVSLHSAKNRKLRLQYAQAGQLKIGKTLPLLVWRGYMYMGFTPKHEKQKKLYLRLSYWVSKLCVFIQYIKTTGLSIKTLSFKGLNLKLSLFNII